ncbi:unnamed protein product [Brachionus calyciflorus]|uniref:Uncharacterized protein n=1 Tax=Brachionus calyciflorus TaxID=104777 RepID=A0A813XC91_9BILA|nr:unnamed protein product [Brachionus calyciflorus]
MFKIFTKKIKFSPLISTCKKNYGFLSNITELKLNNKVFLTDHYSQFTYDEILNLSKSLSLNIIKKLNLKEPNYLNNEKIGIYCSNNYSYLASILSIWMLNGVPFVLNKSHPSKFIEQFIDDFKCKLIINGVNSNSLDQDFNKMLNEKNTINFQLKENEFFKLKNEHINLGSNIPNNYDELKSFLTQNETEKTSFLLVTSGTSGKPKGVVITFRNLLSSIETMITAYKWTPENHILNPLPLNHYSGLVYCFLTPFLLGASVNLMSKFNSKKVWDHLLNDKSINSFIAVPTIYTQMVNEYNVNLCQEIPKENIRNILTKMKFIGSGSAPLNVKTFNEWTDLTQYPMVERYGMTEIGMALSTPLIETEKIKRIGGTVGRPCGKVGVRIYDNLNNRVLLESNAENDYFSTDSNDIFGELQINGPTVFKEYYNRPDLTAESFSDDGWFKTGDTARFLKESNVYKIIGRTSVDVIKSGGHKISALDVEKEIMAYDMIEDCSVMGLSDAIWGQRVFALIVLKAKNEDKFNRDVFLNWCKLRMPKYCVPSLIKIVQHIPKNQLGKVNKKELIQFYENNEV